MLATALSLLVALCLAVAACALVVGVLVGRASRRVVVAVPQRRPAREVDAITVERSGAVVRVELDGRALTLPPEGAVALAAAIHAEAHVAAAHTVSPHAAREIAEA